ncbi:HAMP domain-containing histidine kinase [Agromyces protaetiae]|uniref:histidine kinase n=1 Tax=Agromyces protaetiae TaxID=2509455 RepID=A0A4P6F957_9MICO|nr:HAMP domain-containing sensor histidine kinase [Agromyces protaetiae]QAY72115.1 HAMP domain-containing histidine kinase [Agromyces protaetiae]
MTRPGDPGHAAAARASATAATEHPDVSSDTPSTGSARRRPPWSLRRRIILLVAGLLVATSAVVGIATVVLFHASSVARLDASLRATASRADIATGPGIPSDPRATVRGFLGVPGQPDGTLGGIFIADQSDAAYIAGGELVAADADARLALGQVPADRLVHTITAGTLGEYRSLAFETVPGVRVALALPLADVAAQTRQLALTVAGVAAGGILIALGAGSLLARRALEPLERVTATAQAVSELPLDRGDVDLDERVPVDDPRTEVGQLGTAFNRMLGHVASALSAREQSERKVRRFVADASHELRTPLASIRGYAELTRLHGGKLPADVVHAISRIESESVRMTELVEDLLLLARLDEGREIVHAPVDLGALAADAVADAQAAGPDHDWSVVLPADPVIVDGDEPRLRQVLANLLANARVHTPEGTRVVLGLTVETGSTGDVARLTVSDDGPGIDPAVRDRLFERFARGDASRSRRAGSTGLGLAIVRAVVEAHDGTVDIESEPGETVFTVTLRLA